MISSQAAFLIKFYVSSKVIVSRKAVIKTQIVMTFSTFDYHATHTEVPAEALSLLTFDPLNRESEQKKVLILELLYILYTPYFVAFYAVFQC